jgi:hypothetical protein
MASNDPEFSSYTVSAYSSSVDAALELNLQGIFKENGQGLHRALYLQAVALTPGGVPVTKTIEGKRTQTHVIKHAFGVRFVIEVAKWENEVGFSFSAVLAQTKLSNIQTWYKLEFFGIPTALKGEILKSVAENDLVSRLSLNALQKLVSTTLPEWLERRAVEAPRSDSAIDAIRRAESDVPYEREPLTTEELRMPLGSAADDFNAADAIHHAVVHIARGDTLEQARQTAVSSGLIGRALSPMVIDDVYLRRAGIRSHQPKLAPGTEARQWASLLLNKANVD